MLSEILLGTAVGMVLGLTGSGGVFAMPALIIGLGLPPKDAIPIALLAIALPAALGALDGLRRGIVRYRAALLMAAMGLLLTPLGIFLSHYLPVEVLSLLLSLLLIFIAQRGLRQLKKNATQQNTTGHNSLVINTDTGRFQWNKKCVATLASIGGLSGFCSGMLGVGGGFIIVPGVQRYSNLHLQSIIATSLAVITLISTGTAIYALMAGASIGHGGGLFVIASAIGLLAARRIAPKLSAHHLQLSFSFLAIIAAVILVGKHVLMLT